MSDSFAAAGVAQGAAVHRYAGDLVEETRIANERRLAEARDLASAVRLADEGAAERVLAAAEEANARDLETAARQAEEVVRHARAGILAAVQRYADGLLEETRKANETRLPKAKQLADLVRLADGSAADRLLAAIEEANRRSFETAQEQASSVVELAESQLGDGRTPGSGSN